MVVAFDDSRSTRSLRQRLLDLHAESASNGVAVADAVFASPLFWEKLQSAEAVVLRRRGSDAEVVQEALVSIHQYLLTRGLTDYTDRGEDAFGGWLFALCRRHLRWARARLAQRRCNSQELHDTPTAVAVSERQYQQALDLVVRTIGNLAEPLRGVLRDALLGIDCESSAQRRGISRNYVAILRTQGRNLLRRILSEELVPLLEAHGMAFSTVR